MAVRPLNYICKTKHVVFAMSRVSTQVQLALTNQKKTEVSWKGTCRSCLQLFLEPFEDVSRVPDITKTRSANTFMVYHNFCFESFHGIDLDAPCHSSTCLAPATKTCGFARIVFVSHMSHIHDIGGKCFSTSARVVLAQWSIRHPNGVPCGMPSFVQLQKRNAVPLRPYPCH